jgi:molybdate transport system permease protein
MSPDDLFAILLSLKVALAATVGGLPLALLAAKVLATRPGVTRRGPGLALLDALVHLPLVLPPVATGYGLLLLMGRNGAIGSVLAKAGIVFAFDWTGAALASAVMAFPLMVRPIRLAIEAIEPEVIDSGATLGAGAVTSFLRLTVPLAVPGLIAGAVLGFAKALGEFGATITFAGAVPRETLTLPTAIYQAVQAPGGEAKAITLCLFSAALALAAVLAADAGGRWAARRVGR